MSPAWIRTRTLPPNKKHPRERQTYQVLYRRGGREFRIETAGTMRTLREARIRRDLVAGWLAAGLNPRAELERLQVVPPPKLTLAQWADRYRESRIDYADETAKNTASHTRKISKAPIAAKPIEAITIDDIVDLIGDWRETLRPSSISRYMATLRLVFDFAGVDPNPARDQRVKLPRIIKQEATPPDAEHFLTMLRAMPRRYWLPLVTIEQTGMRVGECAQLTWADVDERGSRFRLRSATVKTRAARWVSVPEWLMALIGEQVPREDRVDSRKVFHGFTGDVAKNAMARACRASGIPVYSPHDLRHRRGTLWHHDPAISLREQMDRGGWTKSQIAIDTYSHVQPLHEVPVERLEALLTAGDAHGKGSYSETGGTT